MELEKMNGDREGKSRTENVGAKSRNRKIGEELCWEKQKASRKVYLIIA